MSLKLLRCVNYYITPIIISVLFVFSFQKVFYALWMHAAKVKVSKFRKQIMMSMILPKNEWNILRVVFWVSFARFLEESGTL